MDADKIQEFFIYHVEKMILVVVLGAAGFLVYSGTKYENILETHQPDRLIADAKQVRAEVDEDHNEMILKDRRPEFDIKQEIERVRSKLEPENYAFEELAPKDQTSSVRRRDPVLHAPKAVQMHGVLASMAIRSSTGEYALKDLEPADPIEKKVEVVREPTEKRGRGRGAYGAEGMEEMMEMFDMEESMDMEMEMTMDMGPSMGGTGATRRLSDALGVRPSSTTHFLSDTEQPPVPGMGWFIAGTAVVPFKSLHESYRAAFADAEGYDPMRRDRPIFKGYEVQRADVTTKSVDQLQEADWVTRDGRKETIRDAIVIWSGFAEEIVPLDYREDETLTMWIPPVMLYDYSNFALHPLVPMRSMKELEQQKALESKGDIPAEIDEGDIIIGEGGSRAPAAYGMDGMDGMEMEMDDMNGAMMGVYGGGTTAMKNPPEYKLIRFYDFANDPRDPKSPQPNHQYVYRVRVIMEDPNFPNDFRLQPKGNSLAEDAYIRVMAKVASVEKDPDPVKKRLEESQVTSEWSEPSDPVSLPGMEKFYVGPVAERKLQAVQVGNRTVMAEQEPPRANIVVSEFNKSYGTSLAMLLESVTEGSVLSKEAEFADIVDPITLEVKKLPDAKVLSGATVIDIDGGLPLAIQEGEGLVEPGLMLLFDETGGLVVHEEVDDQELYRSRSFAEERGE